ncbi:MAG TPA: copper transporter [Actinomycetota bacterium]|nr:copper transporter [Actinomycetota bacterium]
MIPFRYHIFTIVAIFLAIGLGILVGNIYVQPGLVNNLQRNADSLSRQLSEFRAQVDRLNTQVSNLQLAGDILSQVDRGGLADVQVAIVTQDGVEPPMISQALRSLQEAKADVVAVMSVTDRMTLEDSTSRQALARIVGMSAESDPSDLQAAAATLLARRLAQGPVAPAGSLPQSDPLDELLRDQFLRFPPGLPKVSESALPAFGGKDLVVVALDGGQGQPIVAPDDFMIPLVQELVRLGSTVAAGESASTDYPFVPPLRANPPGARMLTVDDVDFSIGGAALVLGLERLVTLGEGGDYGIKGDVRPIPPLT